MKVVKIVSVIILVIIIVFYSKSCYALGSFIPDADEFLSKGNSSLATIDEEQLINTSNDLVGLLTSIGIAVMFIVGTILGIQFMIASAEDKAKVKEALIAYAIGCAVIFGAFTIWSVTVNIMQSI